MSIVETAVGHAKSFERIQSVLRSTCRSSILKVTRAPSRPFTNIFTGFNPSSMRKYLKKKQIFHKKKIYKTEHPSLYPYLKKILFPTPHR